MAAESSKILRCFPSIEKEVYDQLRSDLEPLNGFEAGDFSALTSLVLENLSSMNSKGLIAAVSSFAKANGIKNMTVLENGVRGLLVILHACGRQNLTAKDLQQDALCIGLSSANAAALETAWRSFAKRSSAEQKLNQEVADDFDEDTLRSLVDLQWRFGVTCLSDNTKEPIGKTFLQLKLVLDKTKLSGSTASKNQFDYLELELTLPQFYDFLANLERAKAAVDQIKSPS